MTTPQNKLFDLNPRVTWWEKTVEYDYVIRHMGSASFAAPLAGNHEVAGDTIFARCHSWILIEFKRDHNFSSEKVKYSKAGELKAASLQQKYGAGKIKEPHFFVYGEAPNDIFSIKAKGYWSHADADVSDLNRYGLSYEDFKIYVAEVIEAKKGDATSGASGFGSVVGVTSEGQHISETIEKFAELALGRDLNQEIRNEYGLSSEQGLEDEQEVEYGERPSYRPPGPP